MYVCFDFGCLRDHLLTRISMYSALCEKSQYGEAWSLYRDSSDWLAFLSYNTLQNLLSQCLRNRNLAAAVTVFEDMKMTGFSPNKVTFSMLISGLSKHRRRGSGFRELGYKYWRELRAMHGNLDPAALRIGMQACVGIGKLEEAEEILNLLEERNAAADIRTYNILINGYAKKRATSSIESLFDRMRLSGVKPSITTYNALISSHAKRGRMGEAVRCLERAQSDGIAADAWTYTIIMKGHINNGDFYQAKRAWRQMVESGVKPTLVSFSVMIDCAIGEGDMGHAERLLSQMIEQGGHPSEVTFNSILRAYVADDSFESLHKAVRVLDQMQDSRVIPSTDTLNMLMSAAVSAEQSALAEQVYNRMQEMGQYADGYTYTILIQAYARQGRLPDAVTAFENLSKDPHATVDIAAYNAMVDAFARSGEMEAAEKMLKSTCTFASTTNTEPPVEAFGAVVAGYVRLKMVNAAVNTVRRFHSIGGQPDVQMLDQLIDLCVRTGDYKVAMQAVRAMELVGAEVDKEKYKTMMTRLEERSRARRSNQSKLEEKNSSKAYMERFKFWLGLPNSYYQ